MEYLGFSLNPIETATWVSRIEDFASNPSKYLKIRKRAQIDARERFNINQTAGKLIGAFQDIITQANDSRSNYYHFGFRAA